MSRFEDFLCLMYVDVLVDHPAGWVFEPASQCSPCLPEAAASSDISVNGYFIDI